MIFVTHSYGVLFEDNRVTKDMLLDINKVHLILANTHPRWRQD